ncbi:MAG: recombinase family protein [Deltaproteobacteria bacterium]|nr:recombinase family protein [Deltaproteobacteria bacterium]
MTPAKTPAAPRYVELVRVSGASQAAKDTPADQRAALERLREARPGVLVERIEEGAGGLSGALPLEQRPDLKRLLRLAKDRAFDEVRVRHLDRLTRHPDIRERAAIFGAIAEAGACIVDGAGHAIDPLSEVGELEWTFGSLMAARERKRITERTLAARRRLAGQGKLQGRRPWARTWDGERWGVVEEQVKTYKRLFAEVLAGRSLHAIASGLNADGIRPPEAKQWSAGGVARLVHARSAIGEVSCYGNTLRCPPIVDAPTFEKANKAITWSRAGRPPLDDSIALLRKVAVCGACGEIMYVDTVSKRSGRRVYYRCKHSKTARSQECRRYFAVGEVDALVRAELLRWLAADVAPKAGKKANPKAALARAKARIKELDAEERRLLRVGRRASAANLAAVLAELSQEREEAQRDLEAARLAARPGPAPLDAARREALVRRARSASGAELRALVCAILRPGEVRISPGPRVQIRALGPR